MLRQVQEMSEQATSEVLQDTRWGPNEAQKRPEAKCYF